MNYTSTRNNQVSVSSAQAIAQGISHDGGLFVPESIPHYDATVLQEMVAMSYQERAVRIFRDYLTDFTEDEIRQCVQQAYTEEKFGGANPAPLALLRNGTAAIHMLELWHGPTSAFKDMALQVLPHLLSQSIQKTCGDQTAVILVATSGDTGKAALEGFRDVPGTQIIVFYPEDGVSPMQKFQMKTQEGGNVCVCGIRGNFDDAQTGVKKIFVNPQLQQTLKEHKLFFSSANSINWGRLLPQIVYYISAYCDLMKNGEIGSDGAEVNIVVPTGNFGNILAAYYAMQMGLPVHRLICASNQNHVLTDFIRTGNYNRNRPFYTTISPSMDILISSNLERLLYHMTGGDCKQVNQYMQDLSQKGQYTVSSELLQNIQSVFYGGSCDDQATKNAIASLYKAEHYLCDTHTGVALEVYNQYIAATGDRGTPTIVVSTASPYKFAASVLDALAVEKADKDEFSMVDELASVTSAPIPAPIAQLKEKKVRFENICNKEDMESFVLQTLHLS